MDYIIEPSRKVQICDEVDICVIGGSCTGVFAAVRAARLGAKVIIVEKLNSLGGTATNGHVCVWHSLLDTQFKNQVIAGLTDELVGRLKLHNAVTEFVNCDYNGYRFNSEELKIELDNLVKEQSVKLYLHTYYTAVLHENNKIHSVIIENKDGRRAIKARFFIDASGDGDIARDLSIERYAHASMQPPTACFLMQGNMGGVDVHQILKDHGHEAGLERDWGWSTNFPECEHITMRADNHVFDVNCAHADDLTNAEIEGRRKMRAFVKLMRKYANPEIKYNIVSACSLIGIRETYHYKTKFMATEEKLLRGERYSDAVMNGTYRVDVHHTGDTAGITFRYLDGREIVIYGRDEKVEHKRWKAEASDHSVYYQIPFSILVNEKYENYICTGRMINAEEGAFGALRVMVNLNQLGEAAGVGAYMSINQNRSIQDIDGIEVRKLLIKGGSALG